MPNQPTRLDAAEIEEIKAREKAATPGPWYDKEGIIVLENDTALTEGSRFSEEGFFTDSPDSQFTAHAREDVPRLLATIEAQAKENALLRAQMPVVARVAAEKMRATCLEIVDEEILPYSHAAISEAHEPDFADIMAEVEKEMKTEL